MSETMGQYIKRLRVEQGLTQANVSTRSGVDVPRISKLENDYHSVFLSDTNWVALAKALGCDPDYLLLRSGKIPARYHSKVASNADAVLAFFESLTEVRF